MEPGSSSSIAVLGEPPFYLTKCLKAWSRVVLSMPMWCRSACKMGICSVSFATLALIFINLTACIRGVYVKLSFELQ